jgi:hypothetical protein
MIRPLDNDRWIVHDGLQERAHFLYLTDAANWCGHEADSRVLRIRKRDDDRPFKDWLT